MVLVVTQTKPSENSSQKKIKERLEVDVEIEVEWISYNITFYHLQLKF